MMFAYLDPGSGGPGPIELAVVAIAFIALVLLVIYGLARFIAWAVRR